MKVRLGFVGNSSSSSFLIIGQTPDVDLSSLPKTGKYVVGYEGETCFGWGPETITDVHSRINFAYLQTRYANREDWEVMLKAALASAMPGVKIDTKSIVKAKDAYEAYIDHQSNAGDGENIEIFASAEQLCAFLFNKNSVIEVDHDNH